MASSAPKWVLFVGAALLLWNLAGASMFVLDMMKSPADIAALPQDQQTLWAQMPAWAWAGYGVGTIGGVLAALGIVIRKKWAVHLALLSVLGVLANFVPVFFMTEGVDVWQPKFYVFPLVILVIALFQWWLARKANQQGWTT
jgi:surface polysaccharide O-acyltransferase-like enzyme